MKNIYRSVMILWMGCATLCWTASVFAEEYTPPEGLYDAIYKTYDLLTETIYYDAHLFVDVYLLDENWFALSAIEWGANNQMPLEEIQAYYQESLAKYDPANNFLLLVMLYDPQAELDVTEFPRHVGIYNSDDTVLFGSEMERYDHRIFIIRYPREQVNTLLQNEDTITIRVWIDATPSPEIAFDRNYADFIPEEITALIELFSKTP